MQKPRLKKLAGVPASPGIVMGKALAYAGNEFPEIPRYSITKARVNPELKRLKAAFEAAEKELKAIHERALKEMGREQADIFAAHIMMLEDPDIREQVTEKIKGTLENAEGVIWDVSQTLMQAMAASPDPLFRERAADISDVTKRILSHLLKVKKTTLAELEQDVIVAARDLLPSDVLTMSKKHVKGIVTESGSRTSHTAIVARAFNIPAVLGLGAAVREIQSDDVLVVDGLKGEVFINPGKTDLEKYEKAQVKYRKNENALSRLRDLPAETRDGRRVILKANIEVPEEAETALQNGAEGIGLYRSEFLFLGAGRAASEEQQIDAYTRVLNVMGNNPVTIRTVDIGGDKVLSGLGAADEKNPLLGWRGIRFSLAQPELFKTQLRAILRSSVNGKVRIMFPLVSGLEELEQTLRFFEEAKAECRKKRQAYDKDISAGVMIEVPSAAMIADILAKKSHFLSIGTNDLVQYSLAVDRENERVHYLAQPAHPAVIRLLKMTIDAAHKQGIKAVMCGEMAGDPAFTALLLGLGLDEFSMSASSISQVKRVIRKLNMEDCRSLAHEVLLGVSATENTRLLKSWMKGR